jgi:hypothetical protein
MSNLTNAEDNGAGYGIVSAFNSDSFSLDGGGAAVNASNNSYVGFAWDAGSSTVSNTDGSITANVRANQSAGFSICSYTGIGDGSTESVGHGLNVAPEFVIIKNRDSATNWAVYHKGGGAGATYRLNDTNAKESTSMFDSKHPSSSVIYLKENSNRVNNPYDYIAYCWTPVAGYSAIGSYTANGSSDGPFVHTGFAVAWLLTKRSNAAGAWEIHNYRTPGYNPQDDRLIADSSGAEVSGNDVDFLSNGFKIRNTFSGMNVTNGDTYLYVAFAENPFSANGGLAR